MNPAIELFRGVAAWMVLTSHYALLLGEEKILFHFLWTGVDFFFVMSGFVFAPVLYSHSLNLKAYLIRRIFRIYPLYLFSLLLYYVASEFHPEKLLFFIRHLFFLQTTSSLEEAYFFNPAYWSLPVEIEYYLLIPLFAFLTRTRPYFPLILFLTTFFLSLFLASHATELSNPNLYTILSFHLPGILIEFMLGIILFNISIRYKKTPLWFHFLIFVSGLLLLNYLSNFFFLHGDSGIQENLILKAYFRFFCAIGYSMVLFPCLVLIEHKKSLFNTFCLTMGNMSYAIYLLHYFVLIIFKQFFPFTKGWTAYFICSVAVVILALLSHHLIESPLRNFGRTWAKRW
jgi:peptidoglycan/LPS O-acetylase OafA/YrhL